MSVPSKALVSVAVSSHNRARGLERLFDALAKQSLGASCFEVIVTDDASTDDTPALLARLAGDAPFPIRVLRFEENRGQSAGRNAAWRSAGAPVIAFTDDDCIPTPEWLEAGLDQMSRESAVVVGLTEPDPQQRHLLDPLARTVHVPDAAFAPTCNAFYIKDDLEAVDGFDEAFGALAGEDTDLAWRVSDRLGRKLRFSTSALVYHEVRPRTFRQAVRETRRWTGIGRVVRRHRERARSTWGYFLRPTHPRALLALLGILAAPFFVPFLVLTLPWLRARLLHGRPKTAWLRDLRWAPAALAVDLAEVLVMLRTSVRHRVLIL